MAKKTTTTTTTTSATMAVELSNFNFELKDYEKEKMLVMSFNWRNLENWKTGKSFKYYGLIWDEKKLNFEIFKCKNEIDEKWSLAVFGRSGLIKKSIENWIITEELN